MPRLLENRQTNSIAPSGPASPSSKIKSTRKWPAGGISHWTIPILKRLAHHYPAAVVRIGQIIQDPDHKDNFAACKLVIENLIQTEQIKKGVIEGGEIRISITLAEQPQQPRLVQGEVLEQEAA